jgi:hypothetical protein
MDGLKDSIFVSVEDYLSGELISPIKHEYIAGRIYAMSGGTVNHSAVVEIFRGKDTEIPLPEIEMSLSLEDLYRGVD